MTTTENDGYVTFEFFDSHAQSVHLVGSFNDWSQTGDSMIHEDDGWWRVRLEIPPGDHSFQYLINGHIWQADYAANGVKLNDFGCWVSNLVIKPRLVAVPEEVGIEMEVQPLEPAIIEEEPDVLVFSATTASGQKRRVA